MNDFNPTTIDQSGLIALAEPSLYDAWRYPSYFHTVAYFWKDAAENDNPRK